MSNERSALVDALVEVSGREPGEFFVSAEQMDLLTDERGQPLPGALKAARQAERRAEQQGAGRPKGSRNKRTQELAKWFIHQFGDPLAVLGEIMTMPVDVLYQQMVLAQGGEAKDKKITGKDALRLKREAAVDVLPYIHGKKPIEVDLKGRPDAVIFMPGMNAPDVNKEVLQDAIEKFGIDVIRANGLELVDGRVIDADELRGDDADDDDAGGEGAGEGDGDD